ncbi:MAG: transcription elongation factor GreA [Dehalococcoidales bacterium]|nr:transcription elongation factor GreA [Dehalococcoidales bacterium]
MSAGNQRMTLREAATSFLVSLAPDEREASQQEVYKFIRFYGSERTFIELSAPDIGNYAERLSLSDTDYSRKLELVRAFLIYARKAGWSKINLAIHLKARKGKAPGQSVSSRRLPQTVALTEEGYAEMERALATFKSRRIEAIDEIRRAAADKDFRENAPLDAAKEQRSYLEGQIRELEETLKSAVIIDKKQETSLKIGIGNSIVLCDLASGAELCYVLVATKEVDPSRGKISTASPIGKAVMGRGQGEIVEVVAPAGKIRYEIKRIEH